MKKSRLFPLIVVLLIGIPVVIATVLLAKFDINSYRPEIGAALSQRMGRDVSLTGPIHWGFSPAGGIDLSVKDVSIANLAGLHKPATAKIGRLALALAFIPLLRHELDVTSLDAADVNLYIDKTAASPATGAAKPPASNPAASKGKPLGFHVKKISIKNASLVIKSGNGEASTYKIDSLAFDSKGSKMELSAKGSVNGEPLATDVYGPSGFERLRKTPWPFTGKASYAGVDVEAKGNLDVRGGKIELEDMSLTAGATKVEAKLLIAFGGGRPVVRGKISSDKLDVNDFERPFDEGAGARNLISSKTGPKADRAGQKHIFSRAVILKAVDLHAAATIGVLHVGKVLFKRVDATVDLSGGRLLLSPVSTLLAGGKIGGRLEFDARKSPARATAFLKAQGVDLEQLAQLGGHHSFLKGKSDIDFDIASEGESPQDLVNHARGRIDIVMGRGRVQTRELADMATELLNTLIPGAGGSAGYRVNCLAARLNVFGSRMQSSGILMDTSAATVMGTGEIDLGRKTIDMLLNSRSKLVNVTAFTPSLRISGPLAKPHFAADTSSYVHKVEGLIDSRKAASNVPSVNQTDGQNACVDALDHPQAGQAATSATGKARTILNNTGGSLNRLGGKLLHGVGGMFGK